MRRIGWSLIFALLLTALGAPQASAASCPPLAVWASDDAGDAYELDENLNGGMDILELRVGEEGDSCERVVIGVTVDDPLLLDPAAGSGAQDPDEPFNTASQRVIVDLGAQEGEPVVQLHFVWALRTHIDETSHEGWWVELWVDGTKISDTGDGDNSQLADADDGGYMDASVAKSAIAGVTAWSNASARTSEWLHDAYAEHVGVGYQPDTLDAEEAYTFGYGIGVPVQEVEPLIDEGNASQEPTTSAGGEPEPEPASANGGENGTRDGGAGGNAGDDEDPQAGNATDGMGDETIDEAGDKQSPLPTLAPIIAVGAAVWLRRR